MKLVNKRLKYREPWALPDVYLFTGNRIVRNDGALVMGRGAAREVKDNYPALPFVFGEKLRNADENTRLLWATVNDANQYIGWFQVKHHWKDSADLTLIAESAMRLRAVANRNSHWTFHINYPGIGNGHLSERQVAPLINVLPDNVRVYK